MPIFSQSPLPTHPAKNGLTCKATTNSPRRALGDIQWCEHGRGAHAEARNQPPAVHDGQRAPRPGLQGDARAGDDASADEGPFPAEAVGDERGLRTDSGHLARDFLAWRRRRIRTMILAKKQPACRVETTGRGFGRQGICLLLPGLWDADSLFSLSMTSVPSS